MAPIKNSYSSSRAGSTFSLLVLLIDTAWAPYPAVHLLGGESDGTDRGFEDVKMFLFAEYSIMQSMSLLMWSSVVSKKEKKKKQWKLDCFAVGCVKWYHECWLFRRELLSRGKWFCVKREKKTKPVSLLKLQIKMTAQKTSQCQAAHTRKLFSTAPSALPTV